MKPHRKKIVTSNQAKQENDKLKEDCENKKKRGEDDGR